MGIGAIIGVATGVGPAFAAKKAKETISGGGDNASTPGPAPLPEPPKPADAQDRSEEIARARRSRQSQSVFTSPLGVASEANVVRKKLLGQ